MGRTPATAVALLLAAAAHAPAQPGKFSVAAKHDVDVLAGASLKYPATGHVKQGERLVVVREEETRFYAIVPPAGSVSWVNHRYLGKPEAGDGGKFNAVVMADNVEVRVGTNAAAGPLDVAQVRLPKGSVVEVLGDKVKAKDSVWYPITPPAGEFRYVSVHATELPKPITVPPPPPLSAKPDPDKLAGGTAALPPKVELTGPDHKLWNQAEEAERGQNFPLAESLYTQVYHDLQKQKAESDALLVCYNRIIRCKEQIKTPPASTVKPAPAPFPSPTVEPAAEARGERKTVAGKLEDARYLLNRQALYTLSDAKGVAFYVIAPDFNLKDLNGRQVEVTGVVRAADLYKPLLVAERVAPVK